MLKTDFRKNIIIEATFKKKSRSTNDFSLNSLQGWLIIIKYQENRCIVTSWTNKRTFFNANLKNLFKFKNPCFLLNNSRSSELSSHSRPDSIHHYFNRTAHWKNPSHRSFHPHCHVGNCDDIRCFCGPLHVESLLWPVSCSIRI